MRRREFIGLVAGSVMLLATAASAAEVYPTRPIHLIVPYPPGGGTDIVGRLLGEKLSASLKQPIVVDNRGGAGGVLGTEVAAKAAPDGYTLALVPVGNAAVNPSLFKDLPYDPIKDLTPITELAVVENVLVVGGNSNIKSLAQLIELGRAKTTNITYSTPGAGSMAHLGAELLAHGAGVSLTHVPYRGLAPALTDVLNGEITMTFAQLPNAKPFIADGRLRALGIASPKRSPALPDVPTVVEAGNLPGFEATSWYALMAPAHTPDAIIRKLQHEIAAILQLPAVRDVLDAQGATPVGNTPEELAHVINEDTARWSKLIRDAHIELQ